MFTSLKDKIKGLLKKIVVEAEEHKWKIVIAVLVFIVISNFSWLISLRADYAKQISEIDNTLMVLVNQPVKDYALINRMEGEVKVIEYKFQLIDFFYYTLIFIYWVIVCAIGANFFAFIFTNVNFIKSNDKGDKNVLASIVIGVALIALAITITVSR